MRRRIDWTITASALAVAALVFFAFMAKRNSDSEPQVLLWSERRYHLDPETSAEIEATYRLLEGVRLAQVDFPGTPFSEAVKQIEEPVRGSGPLGPFVVEAGVPADTPIHLKFSDVPASEAIRYLASLNGCRFEVVPGGGVTFALIGSPGDAEQMEGWFEVFPAYFRDAGSDAEAVDVRDTIESFGVRLAASDMAEYYPKRGLLRASTSRDNLELIEAWLDAACYHPGRTWRDRLAEQWDGVKVRLRIAPPPPTLPPPLPDPFGGPSSDPFGGPSGDPFGGPSSDPASAPEP